MFIHTPDGPDLVGVAVFGISAQPRVLTNVFPDLAQTLGPLGNLPVPRFPRVSLRKRLGRCYGATAERNREVTVNTRQRQHQQLLAARRPLGHY
jgi:hypothetical protein